MADWIDITDSAVDPDAPLTSDLGYAFRDNPIAISEGASGAPKVKALAFSNRTSYLTATSVGYITLLDMDDFRTVTVSGYINIGAVDENVTLSVELSENNGATWETAVNILGVNSIGLLSDSLRPYAFTADLIRGIVVPTAGVELVAANFGLGSYNAIRWRTTSGVDLVASLVRTEDCKTV